MEIAQSIEKSFFFSLGASHITHPLLVKNKLGNEARSTSVLGSSKAGYKETINPTQVNLNTKHVHEI